MSGSDKVSVKGLSILAPLAGLVLLTTACAPISREHGYMPRPDEVSQLLVGADTRASVADAIGTPSAQGLTDGGSWFYVASRVETLAFFAPEVVERSVLVLDFNASGILSGINRYALEDGRVVNLQTRVTPTDERRVGVLAQLLGNVGAIQLPLPEG